MLESFKEEPKSLGSNFLKITNLLKVINMCHYPPPPPVGASKTTVGNRVNIVVSFLNKNSEMSNTTRQ